jgi:hypothetical protein
MKTAKIILFFLTFLGCSNAPDIYTSVVHNYLHSIQIIEERNQYIYSDFEQAISNELLCSQKYLPWYNKAITLKSETNEIAGLIEGMLNNFKHASKEKGAPISFPNKSANLDKDFLNLLKIKISAFNDITDTLIDKEKRNEYSTEQNIKLLNTANWTEIKCLKGEKCSYAEIYACLLKIKADLKIAEANILRNLYYQIDISNFKFHKFQIIVEPNAQIIPVGKPYSALIFPAITDTTINITYEIEGEKLKTINGVGKYRSLITETPDKYVKEGNALFRNICGKEMKVPFTIEYEVMKKK